MKITKDTRDSLLELSKNWASRLVLPSLRFKTSSAVAMSSSQFGWKAWHLPMEISLRYVEINQVIITVGICSAVSVKENSNRRETWFIGKSKIDRQK